MKSAVFRQSIIFVLFVSSQAIADNPGTYVQRQDMVYGEVHGTCLLMDVFEPTGKANGKAIIDIASGAWFSDRGKIRDHERAQVYEILCGRGYHVFALRPGSRTKYSLKEMDQHVKMGIRSVKNLAQEYNFDIENIGITGASAGGHLATLAAFTPEPANPKSKDSLERLYDTTVAAVAVFFPPTDFLEWRPGDRINRVFLGYLFSGNGGLDAEKLSKMPLDDLAEMARLVSPVHRLNNPSVPLLAIHGDADPVVHLSQSEKLVDAVLAAGGMAELIVKPGGGHPWPTIAEEVAISADWFDKHLLGE
jgi:acetyl esterase/lipase